MSWSVRQRKEQLAEKIDRHCCYAFPLAWVIIVGAVSLMLIVDWYGAGQTVFAGSCSRWGTLYRLIFCPPMEATMWRPNQTVPPIAKHRRFVVVGVVRGKVGPMGRFFHYQSYRSGSTGRRAFQALSIVGGRRTVFSGNSISVHWDGTGRQNQRDRYPSI